VSHLYAVDVENALLLRSVAGRGGPATYDDRPSRSAKQRSAMPRKPFIDPTRRRVTRRIPMPPLEATRPRAQPPRPIEPNGDEHTVAKPRSSGTGHSASDRFEGGDGPRGHKLSPKREERLEDVASKHPSVGDAVGRVGDLYGT
jgi:hypothetical protein